MKEIVTKCKRCPVKGKGDTYCSQLKKQIWKEDEMCPYGFRIRIIKGIEKASKVFKTDELNGNTRADNLVEQVEQLEKIWEERWKGTAEDDKIFALMQEEGLYGRHIPESERPVEGECPF